MSLSLFIIWQAHYNCNSTLLTRVLYVFVLTANSGAAAGGIIFFLSYIPYLFLQQRYATLSWGAKVASSLVSNIAMSYGGQVIGMFEGTGMVRKSVTVKPHYLELLLTEIKV